MAVLYPYLCYNEGCYKGTVRKGTGSVIECLT